MTGRTAIRHGDRLVVHGKVDAKLVFIDGKWRPSLFLIVIDDEGAEVETVWPLDVPDALYLAATLRADAREVAKQEKKMAEFQAAEEMAHRYEPKLRTPVGCSICARPVAVIAEDGTRYCKRHAETAGVRAKGKIGDPST